MAARDMHMELAADIPNGSHIQLLYARTSSDGGRDGCRLVPQLLLLRLGQVDHLHRIALHDHTRVS